MSQQQQPSTPPEQQDVVSHRGFRVRRRAQVETVISTSESMILAFPSSLQQFAANPLRREQRPCTPPPKARVEASFKRPSSPFSGLSESDASPSIGSEDGRSYGGSVTSIESDSANPFFDEIASKFFKSSSKSTEATLPKKYWTKAMDKHLWAIYNTYLNDPTLTPFKTLPGCPPPTGVCHRVASEARNTWKALRTVSRRTTGIQDPEGVETAAVVPLPAWPGSGAATRHRFRKLCKRKAAISAHYQRMTGSEPPDASDDEADNNEPIPFAASTELFGTRDVAMSLAASTSATMQGNGPLAQLATGPHQDILDTSTTNQAEWLQFLAQNPNFRSEDGVIPADALPPGPPVPEDNSSVLSDDQGTEIDTHEYRSLKIGVTRLGSPFRTYNTWTASSNAANLTPPPESQLGPRRLGTTIGMPRLGSPVQFTNTTDRQNTGTSSKRPATAALDDEETGNQNAEARRIRHEDDSGITFQNASRRLRLRGVSVGAQFVSEPTTVATPLLSGLEQVPLAATSFPAGVVHPATPEDPTQNSTTNHPAPRLRSPFPGIGGRPLRGRHASTNSLPSVGTPSLRSVDQRMSDDIAE